MLRSLERHAEAIRAYDAALSLSPVPIMYVGRASSRAVAGDARGAEADFNRALELEPSLREAWVGRARLFAQAGRYEEARSDYSNALRIRASASVLYELGRLHQDHGKLEQAVPAYETALRICTESALRDQVARDLAAARSLQK
jgi:tetratricopeptide (TPR) repeat protein